MWHKPADQCLVSGGIGWSVAQRENGYYFNKHRTVAVPCFDENHRGQTPAILEAANQLHGPLVQQPLVEEQDIEFFQVTSAR